MMDSLAGHDGGRAEEQLKQERRDQREVHHAHGGMKLAMPGRPLPLLVEWTAVRGLSEPALVRASAATPARRSPGRSVVKCPVTGAPESVVVRQTPRSWSARGQILHALRGEVPRGARESVVVWEGRRLEPRPNGDRFSPYNPR